MGLSTSFVTVTSALDVLRALKNMLKTGWTLDEDHKVLWKDSPAAFPVGFACITDSNDRWYIQPAVKNTQGALVSFTNTSYSCLIQSTFVGKTVRLAIYTSPGGSFAFGCSSNGTGLIIPHIEMLKNANTDPLNPTFFPFSDYGSNTREGLIPGVGTLYIQPSITMDSSVFSSGSYCLINRLDIITNTLFDDAFWLANRPSGSQLPDVLVLGNNRYVRVHRGSTTVAHYFRYA